MTLYQEWWQCIFHTALCRQFPLQFMLNNKTIYYYWYVFRNDLCHCTALHCTALHCTALHCTALHCTALHCTALHCTTVHCTALPYTALHCTAQHRIRNSNPEGLRPSTLLLGHGGSPQYWVLRVDGEETSLFLSNRQDRETSPELWRQMQRC